MTTWKRRDFQTIVVQNLNSFCKILAYRQLTSSQILDYVSFERSLVFPITIITSLRNVEY